MKSNPNVRLNNLRRIVLPFCMLLIFASLSFSIGQKTEYIVKKASQHKEEKNVEVISNVNDSLLKTKNKTEQPKLVKNDSIKIDDAQNAFIKKIDENIDKSIQNLSEGLGLSIILLDKLSESNENEYYRSRLPAIFNSIKMLFISKMNFDKYDFSDEYMSSITKTTLIKSSINFLSVKSELNKLKFEKSAKIKIDNYAKLVYQVVNDDLIRPIIRPPKFTNEESNSSTQNMTSELTKEDIRKKRDRKIWNEAYRATDNQTEVFVVPFSNEMKIDRIENDLSAVETKVRLLVPVRSDNYWVRFDKGFEIRDIDSNEKYLIRRLEEGLPLSKTIIITNKKNKMVTITMVFPLINPNIQRIDIVENVTDYSEIMSNGTGNSIFKDIFVPAYLVTKINSGKIYK